MTTAAQREEVVVLVTGSRDWHDQEAVWNALNKLTNTFIDTKLEQPVLVHGDCKTGADRHAHQWGSRQQGWIIRPYPYLDELGRAGGPVRNRIMVNESKPHYVLAFRKKRSRGTTGTINLVREYAKTPESRLRRMEVMECV